MPRRGPRAPLPRLPTPTRTGWSGRARRAGPRCSPRRRSTRSGRSPRGRRIRPPPRRRPCRAGPGCGAGRWCRAACAGPGGGRTTAPGRRPRSPKASSRRTRCTDGRSRPGAGPGGTRRSRCAAAARRSNRTVRERRAPSRCTGRRRPRACGPGRRPRRRTAAPWWWRRPRVRGVRPTPCPRDGPAGRRRPARRPEACGHPRRGRSTRVRRPSSRPGTRRRRGSRWPPPPGGRGPRTARRRSAGAGRAGGVWTICRAKAVRSAVWRPRPWGSGTWWSSVGAPGTSWGRGGPSGRGGSAPGSRPRVWPASHLRGRRADAVHRGILARWELRVIAPPLPSGSRNCSPPLDRCRSSRPAIRCCGASPSPSTGSWSRRCWHGSSRRCASPCARHRVSAWPRRRWGWGSGSR